MCLKVSNTLKRVLVDDGINDSSRNRFQYLSNIDVDFFYYNNSEEEEEEELIYLLNIQAAMPGQL